MKKLISSLLIIALTLSFFAFPASAQTTLTLSNRSLTLGAGERVRVRATTNSDSDVRWTSSDRDVVTVNRNGGITAVAEGEAVVRATVDGVRQNISITVRRAPTRLRADDVTLSIGDTVRIPLRIASGTASRTRKYEIADTGIATVASNGRVTGVRAGTTTVTVTLFNDVSATATITVQAPSGGAVTPNPNADDFEREVLRLINEERAKEGLPALVWNATLATAARAHSIDMSTGRFMSHTGSDGSTLRMRVERLGFMDWSRVGENVAYGQRTPQAVVSAWMNSPGHRRNIMSDFTMLGVGFDNNYWTQKFARGW